MGLIKCPECGREISSSVETCVHCGCKITVCPDCGKAFAGSEEMCDNCGCKIKPHKEYDDRQVGESEVFDSSIEQGQKLKKTISWIGWGIFSAFMVFAIIIIAKSINWGKMPPLEKLANANSTYNSVKTLIPVCCVLDILSVIQRIPNDLTYYITARRLLGDSVNTDEYYRYYVNNTQLIKKQLEKKDFDDEDDRKESEEKAHEKYLFGLYAVWLIQNRKAMSWIFLKIGFNIVLSAAGAICAGIMVDNAFEDYFKSFVIESNNSFDWTAIVPFAVIFVIELVGDFLLNSYQKKSVAKWQQATNERLGITV